MQTPRRVARISARSTAEPGQVHLELTLKLHSYPNPDREPVKILVIGSKRSVSSIVVALHQLGFAEIFEWTDFLSADRPLQFQPGEVVKVGWALPTTQPSLPYIQPLTHKLPKTPISVGTPPTHASPGCLA